MNRGGHQLITYFRNNITGRFYLSLLEQAITPVIMDTIGNDAFDYDPRSNITPKT